MKQILLMLAAAGVSGVSVSALAQTVMPILVKAPVERVFVPVGFDDNDNAEVVIHGYFKNSCFKVGPATATVDEETKGILISAKAWRYGDAQCTQMLVPFMQSVKLGALKIGSYALQVDGQRQLPVSTLSVVQAPSALPDDYMYAPVEHIKVLRHDDGQNYALNLSGTFPKINNRCMTMEAIKTSFVGQNVLVVQPIMGFADASVNPDVASCHSVASREFSHTVAIGVLPKGHVLIHVRVLNGESVNKVWEVE